MRKIPTKNISLEMLKRLGLVFTSKNWRIDDDEHLFARCCKMLSHFNEPEQEMLIALIDDYLRVSLPKYTALLKDCFSKIDHDILQDIETVYILPLLSPKDFGKSKSSTMIWYLLREKIFMESIKILDNININYFDRPQSFAQKSYNSKLLLLVDDFIGSGDTCIEAVDFLMESSEVPKETFLILSLVAQEEGILRVRDYGISVFSSIVRKKGISDNYNGEKKEKYLSQMRNIEDYLRVDEDFRFGWKTSEALVTMVRTPNNTFPVFWHEPDLPSGKKYRTIFPR